MARTLFAAPVDPIVSAQLAALRSRVRELEAEVAALRAAADLDEELRRVSEARAALA